MSRPPARASRRAGLLQLCAASALVAVAASWSADAGATPVFIDRSTCRSVPRDDVIAILRVELPSQLVEGAPPDNAYVVTIDCAGATVALSISAVGRASRATHTDLAGAPPSVRPRIVALAIAEIVRDLDREALRRPAPEPVVTVAAEPSSAPLPSPDSSTGTSRAVGPVLLGATGQASTFGLDGRWLLGGGLRFEYARGSLFCAGMDAVVLSADEHVSLGTAQVLLTYASPYVGLGVSAGPWQARLGAGYAMGVARLSGHAAAAGTDSATVAGAWMAPYGFGQVALAVSDSVRVDARVLAGWVTASVVGEVEGGGDVNLAGLWTGVQIGAALSL
jgi:hypothetical protein